MNVSQLPLGWLYLPVAFALGALHALEPGHGKSLASAYLVGGKHTWKDAVVLGLATTFSHTAVVVLLAVGSLALKDRLPQAALKTGITRLGAAALLCLGAWVFFHSLRDLLHGHRHGHSHGHDHARGRGGQGLWGTALLGLANGVLPCPGALAALLVALSLGQVGLGLVTVLSYSLGLAVALGAIGILAVEAGRRMRTWLPSNKTLLWMPVMSGLLVAGTGFGILFNH